MNTKDTQLMYGSYNTKYSNNNPVNELALMIESKLKIPRISKVNVTRKKVEEKLKLLREYRLALVTAPAGYGKTTAVADFLAKDGVKHAWFSIDHFDNDPVRFWRYLTASVAGCLNKEELTRISITSEFVSSNITSELFLSALSDTTENIVLVLDDYHLINNEEILSSIAFCINYMPSCLSMIIISRKEDNRLAKLYSREKSIILGTKELAFEDAEAAELFVKRGIRLNAEEIHTLEQSTEGWVMGLVAASLSLKEREDVNAATIILSSKNRNINRILKSEVFDYWPGEMRSFLIHTAFLDKLSVTLCHRVTGNVKSGEILNTLLENHCFTIPLDQDNLWFRYHHLFQEYLLGLLEEEPTSVKCSLYNRGGQWYQEHDMTQDAISCYLLAGELDLAFHLLRSIYLSMAKTGEFSLWCRWMEKIPAQLVESDIRTCACLSWIYAMENQIDKAEIWGNRAQASLDRIKDSIDCKENEYLNAHVAAAFINISIYRMDIGKAFYYYNKVKCDELYTPIFIGELNQGEPNILNTVYGFRGRLNKIIEGYGNTVKELPKLLGDYTSYISVALAAGYYERGNLKLVFETLARSMGRITELKNPGVIVPCFLILAKEKKAYGDFDGALSMIESGKKLLTEKGKNVWGYLFNIFTAIIYLYKGDIESAVLYFDKDHISIFDPVSASREQEYLIYARYLMLSGRHSDSLLLLNRLEDFTQRENRLASRMEILCLISMNYYAMADYISAMNTLHKALELGIPEGYVRTFVDELEPMVVLLRRYISYCKQTGKSEYTQYVRKLLKQTREAIKQPGTSKLLLYPPVPCEDTPQVLFSERELEVMKYLTEERSNQEIASELCITVRTVKFHNSRIYEKLGVKNRVEAIIKMREAGIM